MEFTFGGGDFGDVDMEITDRIGLELALFDLGGCLGQLWQSADVIR